MKAVIFDMDGLMIDSERYALETMEQVVEEIGGEFNEELCKECIGISSIETEKKLQVYFGDKFRIDDFRSIFIKRFTESFYGDGIPVKKGMYELIDYLKDKKYKIGVATSTARERTEEILKKINIISKFSVIICGDMVSKSKPHPEIYLTAAEKLNIEPKECYVLEDSYNGLKSAYFAGMKGIMVPDLLPYNKEIAPYVYKKAENLLEVMNIIK